MKKAKLEYKTKESFVAFIDVLGFSQMILEDGGNGEKLKIIKSAISDATSLLEERKLIPKHPYAFWYEEFQVKSFSDCFCFSIPLEFDKGEKDYKQNFVSFYVWIMAFCNTLLKNGFLCRGGITQGWHYYDDKIIFSKALVDAYLLESKKANHPIILIHQDLISNLMTRGFQNESYYEYMFVHDTAGKSFLHQFNYSIVDEMFFGFGHELKEKFIDERTDLIKMFLSTINNNIKALIGNPAVDKWQWMKDFSHYTLSEKYSDRFYPGLYINQPPQPSVLQNTNTTVQNMKENIAIKPASQDEITLYCFLGEALCKIQILEQALNHSITLKTHSDVTKSEANENLNKMASYTLGRATKLAEEEKLYTLSLQKELHGFLEKRNWLVHKAMPESRNDAYIEITNQIFKKIKSITTQAENLQRKVELDMIDFCISKGQDMSKILAKMNAQ